MSELVATMMGIGSFVGLLIACLWLKAKRNERRAVTRGIRLLREYAADHCFVKGRIVTSDELFRGLESHARFLVSDLVYVAQRLEEESDKAKKLQLPHVMRSSQEILLSFPAKVHGTVEDLSGHMTTVEWLVGLVQMSAILCESDDLSERMQVLSRDVLEWSGAVYTLRYIKEYVKAQENGGEYYKGPA